MPGPGASEPERPVVPPPPPPAGDAPEEGASPPPIDRVKSPLNPGERVGHYTVDQIVGQGGMAVVYRLVDTRGGRPIALKVLTLATAESEAGRLLAREFRVMVRLNHPNVVRVLDLSTVQGHPALFMEYLEGEIFTRELARSREAEVEARCLLAEDLMYQVSAALMCLHTEKVVHRDLKPGNLIRTRDGMLKMMDFGVAQAEHSGAVVSGKGVVVGTPAYMSPEQITAAPVDHRSDLYALGVMVYEVVVGKRPFEAESFRDWQRLHTKKKPVALHKLLPAVPRRLSDVCARLLAKDPSDRFDSVQALLDHLDRSPVNARVESGLHTAPGLSAEAEQTPKLRAPPLVGRNAEADTLRRAVAAAKRQRGGWILLHGETGTGKTRLASTLHSWARHQGVRTLVARCHNESGGRGSPTFGELVMAAARVIAQRGGDWKAPPLEKLAERMAHAFPAITEVTGVFVEPREPRNEGERRRLLTSVICELMEAFSYGEPTLMVIEDLHKASSDTIMLLGALSRWAEEHTLLVVGTLRGGPEEARRMRGHQMLALSRAPEPHAVLGLEALAAGDSQRLVAAMLGLNRAPAVLMDTLLSAAGGSPLVLIESVVDLVRRRRLTARRMSNGSLRWGLAADADPRELFDPVPAKVSMLVAERVGELEDDAFRILRAAAVAAHPVPVGVLHQVVGNNPSADGMEIGRFGMALAKLSDLGWIEERADGVELTSGLAGQSVAQSLPSAQRAAYHLKLAESLKSWAERRGEDELRASADWLAHHYEEAGAPERAARFLVTAASRFQERHLGQRAQEALDRARHLLSAAGVASDDPSWLPLLQRLGKVLLARGDGRRAKETFGELSELARDVGGADGEAARTEALYGTSVALGFLGRPREAVPLAEKALERCDEDDVALRVRVLTALADRQVQRGAYPEGADALQRAQDLAQRAQHEESLVQIGLTAGWLQCAQGTVDIALKLAEQTQRLSAGPLDPALQGRKLALLAEARLLAGGLMEATDGARQALRAASRTGNMYRQVGARIQLARCLRALGDLGGADEAAQVGREEAEQHQLEEQVAWADLVRCAIALERHDAEAAKIPLDQAAERARRCDLGNVAVEAEVLCGWLAIERGDRKAQMAIGKRLAHSGAGERPLSPYAEVEALLLLAEANHLAGRDKVAIGLIERGRDRAEEIGVYEARVRAWHLLGLIQHALRRHGEASEALKKAALLIEGKCQGWSAVDAERFRSRRRIARVLADVTEIL